MAAIKKQIAQRCGHKQVKTPKAVEKHFIFYFSLFITKMFKKSARHKNVKNYNKIKFSRVNKCFNKTMTSIICFIT